MSPRGVALGGGGIGGVILLVILALVFKVNPMDVINQQQQPAQQDNLTQQQKDDAKEFVGVVLRDTEMVWTDQFNKMGKTYQEPRLVMFTGAVESACGTASSAVGPFYCPSDRKVYIDTGFFVTLNERFRAPGDFAQAYVIAHEVGHHVQNLRGTMDAVQRRQQQVSKTAANELSVRLELQADYYAGVWAHYADKSLKVVEPGDIDEALRAANAIGDDKLQMEGQGYVVPDSFTHGTSEQRKRWFTRGYQSGDPSGGNTFGGDL